MCRMKATMIIVVGALLACTWSCKDNSSFHLPDNLFKISKALDIGNSNNATDLRFDLEFLAPGSINDIQEVRLLMVKSPNSFTLAQIDGLKTGNFLVIAPSSVSKQVIKPGAADLKDADGGTISNGAYTVYVAVLGKENSRQLSAAKDITLSDKPIYAGDYIGTWQDLGPPGPAVFPMSLRIADNYTGQMFYANPNFTPFGTGAQDALTTMTLNGTMIASFELDQFIPGYKGGCKAKKTLTGHFEDDINLVLDTFDWPDCDGTREVKLRFERK